MWLVFATIASAFWGLSYVFSEQIYKHVSLLTVLAIECLVMGVVFTLVALVRGTFGVDIPTLTSSKSTLWLLIALIVTSIIAELCIALSISTEENATLSGLIEISYPVFVALFAYLLYNETEVNAGTAFGGALIVIGVAVVYWFR